MKKLMSRIKRLEEQNRELKDDRDKYKILCQEKLNELNWYYQHYGKRNIDIYKNGHSGTRIIPSLEYNSLSDENLRRPKDSKNSYIETRAKKDKLIDLDSYNSDLKRIM